MKNIIEQKLKDALSPDFLEVIDDSAKHAGHSGARPGGNTHFNVNIKAKVLDGKTRVAQQRLIMGELKAEFADTLHALSINVIR